MTQIRILDLVPGAQQATGLTVIIDVLRAFSVACYAFAGGATAVIPVGDVAQARELKRRHPAHLLIGEREGLKLSGFDYGNSPTELQTADLLGKTLIHTTSSGTQGIVNAVHASAIITGAFVNAEAIVRYTRQSGAADISLVAMGRVDLPAIEDTLCATYIRDRLLGQTPDFDAMRRAVLADERVRPFLDPAIPDMPAGDLDLCLQVDVFDFVLRAEPFVEDGMALHRLRRIDTGAA